MKKNLRFIFLPFIICLILLIILSWSSYNKINDSTEYATAVEHTHEVLRKSEELISIIKDYETGQRGYLITKERTFLEPYIRAEKEIQGVYATLKEEIKDNPAQLKRLDTLRIAIFEKIQLLRYNIKQLERKEEFNGKTFLLGKDKMDNIRTIVNRFQITERKLLEERRATKLENDKQVSSFLTLLSIFSFVLLIISFLLIFLELKKRIKFQHQLENKIEELNRSNADLEQFAYVSSHDLQEPLRKIRAFSDRLVRKHTLNEDGKDTLDKIISSAERMQTLINDLLDFSRLVKKKESSFQEVDLQLVINRVVNDLSIKIEEKKAHLIIGKMPYLWGIPFQINQLFLNLISNALKFTKDEVPPVITISYEKVRGEEVSGIEKIRKDRDYHKIKVIDNGIGFEDQYAEKIFVIFQRLHARNHYEGTGVGLAICRRIMTNHNGFIFAKSQINEGASFTLYFPTK